MERGERPSMHRWKDNVTAHNAAGALGAGAHEVGALGGVALGAVAIWGGGDAFKWCVRMTESGAGSAEINVFKVEEGGGGGWYLLPTSAR